jgi:hypothetical protein
MGRSRPCICLGAVAVISLSACSLLVDTSGLSSDVGTPNPPDAQEAEGAPNDAAPAQEASDSNTPDGPDASPADAGPETSGDAMADSRSGDTGPIDAGPVEAGPWSSQDIGAVQAAGTWCSGGGCTPSLPAGSYEVSGSGADISGTSDAFQFVYQAFGGDAVLVARLASIAGPPTSASEKAGVMMRSGAVGGAPNAFLFATPTAANGYDWQVRAVAGASTTASAASGVSAAACGNGTAPVWTKIIRSGAFFSGFCSADGLAWNPVGDAPIAMPTTIQMGLAVTSNNNAAGVLGTATFDSVSLGPAGASAPYRGAPLVIGATQGQWVNIEAENYDLGGNGIAYWDTTPGNAGGVYRNDDVDIEQNCGNNCYDVFDIVPGEWLKHTVSATAGTYAIQLGISSNGVSHMHINDETGANVTGTLTVASTGGLSVFLAQATTATITLTAGTHTLQTVFDDGSMDLNWIQVQRQ